MSTSTSDQREPLTATSPCDPECDPGIYRSGAERAILSSGRVPPIDTHQFPQVEAFAQEDAPADKSGAASFRAGWQAGRKHHVGGAAIQPANAGIGDWSPRQGECYANCDIWVIRSPEYRVIRGWVVFDLSNNPLTRPHFRFVGHSIIVAPDGKPWDITPNETSQAYPFLEHPGPFGEFEALRQAIEPLDVYHWLP